MALWRALPDNDKSTLEGVRERFRLRLVERDKQDELDEEAAREATARRAEDRALAEARAVRQEQRERQRIADAAKLSAPGKPNVDRMARVQLARNGKYDLTQTDGIDDLVLKFGMHRDHKLSELSRTPTGRKYLKWMLNEDFPGAAKIMIRKWMKRSAKVTPTAKATE